MVSVVAQNVRIECTPCHGSLAMWVQLNSALGAEWLRIYMKPKSRSLTENSEKSISDAEQTK